MEPWPLERVASLDEDALAILLLAFTRGVMAARDPLPLPGETHQSFSCRPWNHQGLDRASLKQSLSQFHAMLGLGTPTEFSLESTPGQAVEVAHQAWRRSPRPVTFFTSGSTGQPKPCTHLETYLRQEVANLAPLFGEARSALVTVPHYHLFGFTFGLLLPLTLGIPIKILPPLSSLIGAQMSPGDLVVGIPLLWSRLAASPFAGSGITALTATSPMPAQAMRDLTSRGFNTIEIYGSSETGAIGFRRSPDLPFMLLPHWRRGEEDDPDRGLFRIGPDGREGYYPMQDKIEWLDERHLLPHGRRDNAVRVAGHSVFPQRVAEALSAHPGVQECLVRLMRPEEGHRLKAFVVSHENYDTDLLRKELVALARAKLREVERPAAITFGSDLPRGTLGKPGDW